MTQQNTEMVYKYTILENAVLKDVERFNKNEVLAYMSLMSFANEEGRCFPSYDEIARIMRTSRRTAIDAVNGLVSKGVVKIENRPKCEKKKEMTSNLYTLVSSDAWNGAMSNNRLFMLNRKTKYSVIVSKAKATKVAKNLDKKNKPECESDLLTTNIKTHNECFLDTSIPSGTSIMQQENSDKVLQKATESEVVDSQNVKMLKENNIKFAPINKDRAMIDALDTEVLKQAIATTVDNASIPNWNYVKKVYGDLMDMPSQESKPSHSNDHKVKTRFHNINQTFTKYSPNELEKLLQESQKGKFTERKPVNETRYKKTGFHNFDETFTQYSEAEFNDMVDRMQATKW